MPADFLAKQNSLNQNAAERVSVILKHLASVTSGEFLALFAWSSENLCVITDMAASFKHGARIKKQDDHRVGSLPLLIKKSLWAAATSKYPWCLHPAAAVKWAGEAGIKRHRRLQHAFTAAHQTDTKHKRDKSLHYLWKWLNYQEKPAVRPPGMLFYSKICFLLCYGKNPQLISSHFLMQKTPQINGSLYKFQQRIQMSLTVG